MTSDSTASTARRLREKSGSEIASIVRAMESVGPGAADVARVTGEPVGRVRRIIGSKILGRRLGINPNVNVDGMGRRRRTLVADPGEGLEVDPMKVLLEMDEKWFLTNAVRTVPDSRFILDFDVPRDRPEVFDEFVEALLRVGFITKVRESMTFEWRRYATMRTELFDFKTCRWDFDWSTLATSKAPPPPRPVPVREIHLEDLTLVTEMQADCRHSLAEMANYQGMSYSVAAEHIQHVMEGGLITGYTMSWVGPQDPGRSINWLKLPHKYLPFDVAAKNLTEREMGKLRDAVNSLPFMSFERGGREYYAELFVPLDHFTETMDYLRKTLAEIRDRVAFYMGDWHCTVGFTPPRKIFDGKSGRWVFDVRSQIRDLEEALAKVRGDR